MQKILGTVALIALTIWVFGRTVEAQQQPRDARDCAYWRANGEITATNGFCPDSAKYPVNRPAIDKSAPTYSCHQRGDHYCWFMVWGAGKSIRIFRVRGSTTYFDRPSVPGSDQYCGCVDSPVQDTTCHAEAVGHVCRGPGLVGQHNKSP